MVTKKAPPNYDYTVSERVKRERATHAAAGGVRVEAMLDADDMERLDALIESGVVGSRRSGLKYAVQQLPAPKKSRN